VTPPTLLPCDVGLARPSRPPLVAIRMDTLGMRCRTACTTLALALARALAPVPRDMGLPVSSSEPLEDLTVTGGGEW
jgi:hypothetical protein